jgi:hypothetical protein
VHATECNVLSNDGSNDNNPSRLAGDSDLRVRLRAKARERAQRQFSLERFCELAPSLQQPFGEKE